MTFARSFSIIVFAALCLFAQPSAAQTSLIPDIFGGPDPAACQKNCKDVKDQCRKEFDRLKTACKVTGRSIL